MDGWKRISLGEFIADNFAVIHSSDFGKQDNLRCQFCDATIFLADNYLSYCCKERKEKLELYYAFNKEEASNQEENEKFQRILIFNNNLRESGIEGIEKGVNFGNFKIRHQALSDAVQVCRDFTMNDNFSLILSGAVGSGKTHLAIATAKLFGFERKRTFGILRCSNIGIDAKNDFDVLILDDIGRELGSDAKIKARRGIISEIVEIRHRNKLKTIFTTNLTSDELIDRFGSHIFDRITHKASIVKRLELESYRGME